jgi:thiol-disulfide isomerase/thioredoxin
LLPLLVKSQSAKQIVDRYISASGGIEKWNEIISCKENTLVWQNLNFMGIPDSLKSSIEKITPTKHEITKAHPNFETDRIISPDGSVSIIYNNDKNSGISTAGMFFPSPAQKFVVIAMPLNILLLQKKGLLKFIGNLNILDRQCFVLEGPYNPDSAEQVRFFFDRESGLLLAIKNFNQTRIRTTFFSDYQKTQELNIPFSRESYSDEILYYREIIQEIEFNPSLDKSQFYYRNKVEKAEGRTIPESKINSSFNGDLNTLIKSNYKNKRVLIDIWATWCAPCKIEFKKYDSLFYKALTEMEINLLFIRIDKTSNLKAWRKDINRFGLNGDHILAGSKLLESLRVVVFKNETVSIPRYVVIDNYGKILTANFNRPSDPSFIKDIKGLYGLD